MKVRFVVAAVLLVAGSALQGQDLQAPKCPGGSPLSAAQIAQDACQQAYDVYQFLSPELGLSLTGGNATAGQGGVLGGVGRRVHVYNGVARRGRTRTGSFATRVTSSARRPYCVLAIPDLRIWWGDCAGLG